MRRRLQERENLLFRTWPSADRKFPLIVFLVLLHFHQQITNLLKCPKTKPQKQYFYKMDLKSSVLFLLIQLSVSLSLHIITSFADIPLNSTLYASNFNQSWPLPNSTFSLSLTKQTPLSFIPAITHSGGAPVSTAGKTPSTHLGPFSFIPPASSASSTAPALSFGIPTLNVNVSSTCLHDFWQPRTWRKRRRFCLVLGW